MTQSKIIEYIDQGNFICTLCLQDKGNRLHLLTLLNREVNLSPKRALLTSNVSIDPLSPREVLLNKLRQIENLRNDLQEKVLIEDLWELVRDENESFDYKDLAQLCFNGEITDDHISALVRAMFEDKLYFKMKDGRIHPNSREKVDQILRQREEEALKEEILKQGGEWMQAIVQGKDAQDPPCRDGIISLLTELVLHRDDAPNFKYGKDLISRAGISTRPENRTALPAKNPARQL